ncbi:MAG: tripartite tricarboxylate transporter substrate binding protein [Desulfovibrionaceae bacterium]|nr:tripartite tricarboxylate transporter substrate binding protein [Desulfovibrionaceae bacterium]
MPSVVSAFTPEKQVTVIVAYKSGSGTDTGARLLTRFAQKYVGQPLIIENLPGGYGKIGWSELARSKPDGYTLGFINLPTFTTFTTQTNTSFTVDSIVPIANHLSETCVIVVKADSPWRTLDDLVKACKQKSNYRCATNGNKASNHTAAQLLATTAKFKYRAVHFGGTADQLLALRQGEVQFSCAKVADIATLVSGPKPELRVLGVFAGERLSDFPNVPTLKELGFYPYWYGSARALVAPKGTPKEIIAFYEEAFRKTMEDPECIAVHKKAGLTIDFKNSADLNKLIQEQLIFCRDVIAKLF